MRSTLILLAAAAAAVPAVASAAAPLSQHDLMLLNRITWGATPADAAEMQKLGSKRWLERQLHPGSQDRLPDQVQAVVDALPASQQTLPQLLKHTLDMRQSFKDIPATDVEGRQTSQRAYKQYLADRQRDAVVRSLLRDIYSPDQLQEQLTWFWFNHFNVFSHKHDIRAMLVDYEDTIRAHSLGKFRDLLEATVRHPAMLEFLDNDANAVGRVNENYAREIMELHTMGVGSGYTQKDVQELARILTGVGVRVDDALPAMRPGLERLYIRQGDFEFNPKRHDFGDKQFLGHTIKGTGLDEVEQALDILSRQPATARHVSRQLAQYFVGDDPPPALVARMAQTFQKTNGDIAEVLRTLFDSKEFDASLGTQFKDPVHYVVSAVRLAYGDQAIINTNPIDKWLIQLSESLYDHETPDGYPMNAAAWNGPGQLAARFDIARAIAGGAPGLFVPPNRNPDGPAVRPEIQATVQKASLDRSMASPTRTVLGKAASPQEWNALFLSSPEFMRR
jgi:uncharacterized protein (DUF1800 family)